MHWSAHSCAFLASSLSQVISSMFSAPGCPGMSPCATAWRNLLCSSSISYLSDGSSPDFNRTPPLRQVCTLSPTKLQTRTTMTTAIGKWPNVLRLIPLTVAIFLLCYFGHSLLIDDLRNFFFLLLASLIIFPTVVVVVEDVVLSSG